MKTKISFLLLLCCALFSFPLAKSLAVEIAPTVNSDNEQEAVQPADSADQTESAEQATTADSLPDPNTSSAQEFDDSLFSTSSAPYFAASDYLSVNTQINGDAYLAGNNVEITNTVTGDLFVAGNKVTVDGTVADSLRIAAGTVDLSSTVFGNVLIVADVVNINQAAKILGHTNIYANKITISGALNGETTIRGSEVVLNGTLNNQANIQATKITTGATANITKTADFSAEIFSLDAKTQGTTNITTHTLANKEAVQKNKQVEHKFNSFIRSYFFFVVIGILLILIWPTWSGRVITEMQNNPKKTWFKGAIYFFAAPTVLLMLIFTLVGIPLAVLGALFYLVSLALGKLFAGAYLGHFLVQKGKFQNEKKQQIICLIVGYFILSVLMQLPWLGWLIMILAVLWGAGGMIEAHKTRPKMIATKTKKANSTKPKKKAVKK